MSRSITKERPLAHRVIDEPLCDERFRVWGCIGKILLGQGLRGRR
jgi:hypothetical protein